MSNRMRAARRVASRHPRHTTAEEVGQRDMRALTDSENNGIAGSSSAPPAGIAERARCLTLSSRLSAALVARMLRKSAGVSVTSIVFIFASAPVRSPNSPSATVARYARGVILSGSRHRHHPVSRTGMCPSPDSRLHQGSFLRFYDYSMVEVRQTGCAGQTGLIATLLSHDPFISLVGRRTGDPTGAEKFSALQFCSQRR
jgi:hypothetical protein